MSNEYFDRLNGTLGAIGTQSRFDDSLESILTQLRSAQTKQLERELRGVTAQLAQRDAIHEAIVDDLAWKLDLYTDKLRTLYSRGTGQNGTREQVKDRITEFETALRDEYRAHWRDRQTLEEERRAITRELSELDDGSWSELLDGD